MEEKIANIKEMKQESLERMKILKLHENAIKEFETENNLNKSEGIRGALYWLNEKEQQMVKEFEKKRNVMIYHIIHSFSNLGETYDLLFVTKYKNEWKDEKRNLKLGYALSRTEVVDYLINSESGVIGIESRNGGVIRVC